MLLNEISDNDIENHEQFLKRIHKRLILLKTKFIHFHISNLYFDYFSFTFSIEENVDRTVQMSEMLFEKRINKLLSMNIHICSVLIDHSRAQKKGFLDFQARSIQISYCLAHATNLVYIHSTKANTKMRSIINNLFGTITILRKAEAVEFIKKYPLPITTRWIYIMDPLHSIIHHQNVTKEYFVVHGLDNFDIFQYSVLNAILLPLKIFTLWVE